MRSFLVWVFVLIAGCDQYLPSEPDKPEFGQCRTGLVCSADCQECIGFREGIFVLALPIEGPTALFEAATAWNESSGKELFITVSPEEIAWGGDGVLTTELVPDFGADLTKAGQAIPYPNGCHLMIREDLAVNVGLWEHELGHCLGFIHSRDKTSIMYPAILPEQSILPAHGEALDRLEVN